MKVKEPIQTLDADPDATQPNGWRWQDVSVRKDLTNQQELFAQVYAATQNATKAYRVAYAQVDPSQKTCAVAGARCARNPKISARVQELREDARRILTEKAGLTADKIAQLFYEMAMADPNEIIGARVGCCRYCYGEGFRFQWKEHEYLDALAKWEHEPSASSMPDVAGGFDFDQTAEPNPECPNCMGEGEVRVVAQDTSQLSDGARMLYQGVKQTRNGLEIQIADRAKMLENLARLLGAFKDNSTVTLSGAIAAVTTAIADPDQAQQAYMRMLEASGPA